MLLMPAVVAGLAAVVDVVGIIAETVIWIVASDWLRVDLGLAEIGYDSDQIAHLVAIADWVDLVQNGLEQVGGSRKESPA